MENKRTILILLTFFIILFSLYQSASNSQNPNQTISEPINNFIRPLTPPKPKEDSPKSKEESSPAENAPKPIDLRPSPLDDEHPGKEDLEVDEITSPSETPKEEEEPEPERDFGPEPPPTPPNVQPAYSFVQFQTTQNKGDIIQRSTNTSYDHLRKLCDSIEECRAFDTEGHLLKTDNWQETKQWTASMYIKRKDQKFTVAPLNVWPLPKDFTHGGRSVTVSPSLFDSVVTSSPILKRAIQRYKRLTFIHTLDETSQSGSISKISIRIESGDEELHSEINEAYHLNVTKSKVKIIAPTVYGALHALETLSQMVYFDHLNGEYKVDHTPWVISDKPDFKHRGVLIDTSRHFHSVQTLERIIESMSYAKFNVLHWHIVDGNSFPFEVKSYPKLWEASWSVSERYTQKEIRYVVNFAKFHGIRVMVELDNPGHATSWGVAYPEVLPENWQKIPKCWNQCPSIYCGVPVDPTEPKSREIIDAVIKECAEDLFPDKYFHLGGDEVPTVCWSDSQKISSYMQKHSKTHNDLYLDFVKGSTKTAMDAGKIPVHWEEVYSNFRTQLDKKSVVHVWWNGDLINDAARDGYDVIVSTNWWYLDVLHNDFNRYYTNDPFHKVAEQYKSKILGGEVAVWSEKIDSSNLFRIMWPKAAGAAERLWTYDLGRGDFALEKAMFRQRQFRCRLLERGVPVDPNYSWGGPNHPSGCLDT